MLRVKNTKHGEFENQAKTLRVKLNLTKGKPRGELENASNNSMDVRAKQLLCFNGVSFPSRCVAAVSPHVISTVRYSACYTFSFTIFYHALPSVNRTFA